MKTLKKTLCLVLAVVLALGVMVLPAYADKETYDNFVDKETIDIKHKEAVGALTGLGVINGRKDEEGSKVQADSYINRAEAVTMLVRAVLGDAVNTLVKVDTKFTDVTKAHYAAAYIQYAVENGIVAGKSDDKFVPDDLVTGYELARMALVAADIKSDFTSAAWQNQTGVAASKANLLVGLENITDLNKALTREEAAELLWNTVRYKPDEVTLKVEQTSTTKNEYTVTYPEESIGGKVYNLAAHYNYKDGHGDFEDAYGAPSVKWYNAKTNESYYEGAESGIVSFYADDKLTIGDVKEKLGVKTGISANVYVDGYVDNTSNIINTTDKDDADVPGTTVVNNDRGAQVSIYKAPFGNVTYFIYVNYTYVAYNHTATAEGATAYAGRANTGNNVGDTDLGVAMDKETIAIFGLSTYLTSWHAVNVKVHEAAANVNIVRKSNNSKDPYFYLSNNASKKLYASAMAIYVKEDGTVEALDFTKHIDVSGKAYFDVWYDNAGNVLALVEADPATTPDVVTYTDFGYVLEFTSTKATGHIDDMAGTKGEDTVATAQVLMVNLKSGRVGIYKLDVQYDEDTETWYALGVDGEAGFAIETSVTSATAPTNGQTTVPHKFVAYKQLDSGKYGITAVTDLKGIGSTNQDFKVATSFSTDRDVPGRVIVNGDTNYANAKTEIRVLSHDEHTVMSDGSRVKDYPVTVFNGYAALDTINVHTDEECDNVEHKGEVVGVEALFCVDSKTKMITQAYVFGDQTVAPKTVTYDYWVLIKRGDADLDGGTDFTFLHDGEVVVLHADKYALKDMEIQRDDAFDAGTVCYVEHDGNKLIGVNTDKTGEIKPSQIVSGTAAGFDPAGDGKYYGYIDLKQDDGTTTMLYFAKGCWIFDDTVDKKDPDATLVDNVDIGDTVTVYYATDKLDEIALIVITKNA